MKKEKLEDSVISLATLALQMAKSYATDASGQAFVELANQVGVSPEKLAKSDFLDARSCGLQLCELAAIDNDMSDEARVKLQAIEKELAQLEFSIGDPVESDDFFRPIVDKPQHEAFLAPSGAGMSFNFSKEMTNE